MTSFAGARPRREEGAALVMALLFLTVCAVTIGGLLTFANTSSSATTALRTARGNEYDTQAAMDAAIATVRTGATCGTVASGYTPTWTLNNTSPPAARRLLPGVELGDAAQRRALGVPDLGRRHSVPGWFVVPAGQRDLLRHARAPGRACRS